LASRDLTLLFRKDTAQSFEFSPKTRHPARGPR
jgi:hypothetical protein